MNDFAQLWAEVKPIDTDIKQIYRLYYDETGEPLFYSTEDLPGLYIDITQEEFNRSDSHVRVKNGKIEQVETVCVRKLVPFEIGTSCHPSTVTIVVDADSPNKKWKLRNETD